MPKRKLRIARSSVPEHTCRFTRMAFIDNKPAKTCTCGAYQPIPALNFQVNAYDEYLGFYGKEKKRIAEARKAAGLDYRDGNNTSFPTS